MTTKCINILLLGKTGNGKSATGNTILKRKAFKTSGSMSSVTKQSVLECSILGNKLIRVVDTPGLMDTQISNEETLKAIFNSMSLCPEGFNALVFVMAYGQRFTNEEQETLELLRQAFGESIVKDFCYVIMTRGDTFDSDFKFTKNYTFEKWLDEQKDSEFMKLLDYCRKRVFLFYNKVDYKKQRKRSLKLFLELIDSREDRYTSDLFEKCSVQRNEMVAELRLPAQKQFFQEKLSLFGQDIQSARDSVYKIKSALADVEVQKKKVQVNLHHLKENIQNVIDETEKETYESEIKNEFISKLKKLKKEVEDINRMSYEEKEEKLTTLLEHVRHMKDSNADNVNKGFSVIKQALKASAIAGFYGGSLGLAAGVGALEVVAATTATAAVATVAAPILIVGGVGAAAAYYFTNNYFTKKLAKDKQ